MESAEVRGKFKSLTQGQKSDNVIYNMAATFSALCEQADWTKPKKVEPEKQKEKVASNDSKNGTKDSEQQPPNTQLPDIDEVSKSGKLQLHYNIQLILPPSRDPAVFDALFASLKRHLL